MLTWGFEAEAERMAKHARRRVVKNREKERNGLRELCDSSSTSLSLDENTTDEEYFKLIAGEEEDDDEEEDDPRVIEMRKQFNSSDENKDGNLSLKEFIALSDKHRWDMPSTIRGSSTDLEKRVRSLEDAVAANAVKLDRILQLLEKR